MNLFNTILVFFNEKAVSLQCFLFQNELLKGL